MQGKKSQELSQKGSFLKKPSEKLAKLLEIVNAVPQNVLIQTIYDKNTLELALKTAPEVFRHYVAPDEIKKEIDVQEAKKRFEEAAMWRNVVFAFQFLSDSKTKLHYDFNQPLTLAIQRDDKGVIRLRENLLTEVLKEGVDAASVRSCANCQRLFFKGRKDQKCCSTTCTKQLQTRKWREKLTEEQKEEQRLSYKANRIKKGQK